MNGNIRVGSLFGIPFYVNPSWFLVLGLVTWSYGEALAAQFPYLSSGSPLLLGLVTALLLFASVLAHELGHSFVAIKQGIKVDSITLFLFGGLASLQKESDTPAGAFWVAIAGPAVSFAIFGILSAIGLNLDLTGPLAAILTLLAAINLSLGAFNLIPGLPLDGGNILKAIVWKITGNPYKGVKFASVVGQIFGWVAIASGLLPIVLSGSFNNLWNLLIGTFLLQNAGRSAQFARVRERLDGMTVGEAVTPDSPIVPQYLTLREFVDSAERTLRERRALNNSNWQKFLVTDDSGYLVGEFNIDALQNVPSADRWSEIHVGELMQPIEPTTIINADLPLLQAIEQLESQRVNALSVTDNEGILLGILEKTAVINLLRGQPQVSAA